MQLGSFKSVLGSFLSQLGFSPWPTGTVTLPTLTAVRHTWVVSDQPIRITHSRQALRTVRSRQGVRTVEGEP